MEVGKFRLFKSTLNFCLSLEKETRKNFSDLLKQLSRFVIRYNEEISELPYHINIIDELHADENAHSRIFAKLLRYKVNNRYPILEDFLQNVCKFDLHIKNPKVKKVDSCGRIDIPIFDQNFVVIIENKVTDKAPDQNNTKGGQLARYIETINHDYRRSLDNIFVVYTPKYTRTPSDECWLNEDNYSYKDDFKHRFLSVSYRDVIYPWFKNNILHTIDKKNIYLRSAIEQYIDHLEGLFSLRSINKKMNMNLQEFLKKELGLLDNKPEEAKEILTEKENELNNALNQVQQLKDKYKKQIVIESFEKWKELLKSNYPGFEIVGDIFKLDKSCINVGLKFSIENKKFVALIECNDYRKPNIYYGIGKHFASMKKNEIPSFLQDVIENNKLNKPDEYWYGWNYTSFEKAYDIRLKNLIDDMLTQIDIEI